MRWTKVRQLIEQSFADSVRKRVRIHETNADPRGTAWQNTCKEGSIWVDGHVVAHIDPHHLRKLTLSLPISDSERETILIVEPRPGQRVPDGATVGTFLDFPGACWEYLQLSLKDSLASTDPIVASLAVLSAKVGMQRLRRAAASDLHPLTRWMVEFRIAAERELRAGKRENVVG